MARAQSHPAPVSVRSVGGMAFCASSAPVASSKKCGTRIGGKSSGKLSGQPFDMHRFKAVFPDRWASFLRAHFQTSARVAAFFDVDDKTARNWLHGISAPSGPTVLFAVTCLPGVAEYLMGDAA